MGDSTENGKILSFKTVSDRNANRDKRSLQHILRTYNINTSYV